MKYIITESKLEKIILKYLDKMFPLKEYRMENHPNVIFFVMNDKVYAEYDTTDNIFYVSKRLSMSILLDLEKVFALRSIKCYDYKDAWFEKLIGGRLNNLNYVESLPLPIERYK